MNKWYNSSFADNVGFGLMIMFIAIGLGSCCRIANPDVEKEPIVVEETIR